MHRKLVHETAVKRLLARLRDIPQPPGAAPRVYKSERRIPTPAVDPLRFGKGLTPDIVCYDQNDVVIGGVEIRVTAPVSREKWAFYRTWGLDVIEVAGQDAITFVGGLSNTIPVLRSSHPGPIPRNLGEEPCGFTVETEKAQRLVDHYLLYPREPHPDMGGLPRLHEFEAWFAGASDADKERANTQLSLVVKQSLTEMKNRICPQLTIRTDSSLVALIERYRKTLPYQTTMADVIRGILTTHLTHILRCTERAPESVMDAIKVEKHLEMVKQFETTPTVAPQEPEAYFRPENVSWRFRA